MKSRTKVILSLASLVIVVLSFQNCGVDGVSNGTQSNNSQGVIVDENGIILIPAGTATPTPSPGGGPSPTPTPSATPASTFYPGATTITVSAKVGNPFEVRIPFVKTNAVTTTFVRTTSNGPFVANLSRLIINGMGALTFGFVGSVNVGPAGTHTEVVTFNAPVAEGSSQHKLTYTIGGVAREVTLNVTVAP